RQRAQLHGEVDRRGGEDRDAVVLRLHALQRRHPDPIVRRRHASLLSMTAPVLVLPGYGDSGPEHWQSLWEAADASLRRVVQRDWLAPTLAEWRQTLDPPLPPRPRPPLLLAPLPT